MQKKLKGILLLTKVYKDNDLFIKFLSETDELITGFVYGGMSKTKKNIYQVGFFLDFNIHSKPNRPLSISADLSKPYMSAISNDKYKISCLISIISLINISIIEGQKINNIYSLSKNFINLMIKNKNWIILFLIYLLNILKVIGYEIDYKNNIDKKYYDLQNQDFTNTRSVSTLLFPHELFYDHNKLKISSIAITNMFNIFESVFIKNHLQELNLHLPNQYQLFKKLILGHFNKHE